ncbi:Holliday junction resolvase RuvX [Natranaerofaba carboxydovora]|uniref:Holliday junction resolvase RuvX n=1 Tax=Natranaerofaba carboxydovora TaxID=2742683 RepID=UPI001F136E43|nr:Holliday junction resolvase RuvX [Natranaerofaba carboxydovora]UMZ74006.1 Putative pre-16S rRNA nuclease [Natranaerofaba carboxydovora]
MRIMGLDYGEKRIGVAISDELKMTAQGITVIKRTLLDKDIEKIKELVLEYNVSEIVVGIPKNMDGTLGFMAEEVKEFAKEIQKKISISLELQDERLSSKAAERTLLEGDVSRKKRKEVIDKMAAVYLLQGYLDSKV